MFPWAQIAAPIDVRADKVCYPKRLSACRRVQRVEIAILVGGYPVYSMHSPRVYLNNIGSICTDNLRHGNGLSALLLLK